MRRYRGYIFDLDGTVYLGPDAIPGAPETIAALRRDGARCVFLSNKPIESVASYEAKLTRLGIPAVPGDVLNSSVVMARYLRRTMPGARVYLIGEAPLADELVGAGCTLTTDPLATDVVVVSWDRQFTYQKLDDALQAILRGARFVATHPDRTCPVPGGVVADAGGMIAAVEAVTGKACEVITGKPSAWTIEFALERLGIPPAESIMIGDRLETDMRMGINAGIDTAVVLTGVTQRRDLETSAVKPTYVLESLRGLIEV